MKTKKDVKKIKKAKAKFVQPRPGEIKEIIRGKTVERIQRQNSYREKFLQRKSKEAKLVELKKVLDKAIKTKRKHIKWLGQKYPIDMMVAEFNLEMHYYKVALQNENYLEQALKNDGLSKKDIEKVLLGTFKRDKEKLKKVDYIG